MKRAVLASLYFSLLLAIAACGASTPTPSEPAPADVSWPDEMVSSAGTGPALFIGPSSSDAAIGYLSEGVTLEIRGTGNASRVPVRTVGGLRVRGWVDTSRLGMRVQEKGRVRGCPGYVAPNDIVTVLGPSSTPGLMRISVSPTLRDGTVLGPFEGEYPADRLAATEASADAAMPTQGTYHTLPRNRQVAVYGSRGGEVVATLPPRSEAVLVQVVVEREGWKGVRIGDGPYLSGWINVDTALTMVGTANDDPTADVIPTRLARDRQDRALWRIPERARVRFPTVEDPNYTFAILRAGGYALELARHENEGRIDAFVAVDDHIAVRGFVDIDSLQPLEP